MADARKLIPSLKGWEFDGSDFYLDGKCVGRLNCESGANHKFQWVVTKRYGQILIDAIQEALADEREKALKIAKHIIWEHMGQVTPQSIKLTNKLETILTNKKEI